VAYTPGKSIAVTNTSRGPLSWSTASKIPSWLNIAHTEASLAAGESTQIPVSVDTAWLQPGSYDAHITITATDSTGTPVLESSQEVLVQLKVEPLCSLQVKPSSLTFYDTMSNSQIKQEITIKRTGYCTQPVIWTASVAQKQIILSSSNGHDNGRGSIVAVSINKTGKGGVYMGKIIITARGRDGTAVLDSPQVVEVRIMRDQR
jgi:Tfp pilus assembly protein FimT